MNTKVKVSSLPAIVHDSPVSLTATFSGESH